MSKILDANSAPTLPLLPLPPPGSVPKGVTVNQSSLARASMKIAKDAGQDALRMGAHALSIPAFILLVPTPEGAFDAIHPLLHRVFLTLSAEDLDGAGIGRPAKVCEAGPLLSREQFMAVCELRARRLLRKERFA